MTRRMFSHFTATTLCALLAAGAGLAQVVDATPVDKSVTIEAAAAGADEKAKDEAVAEALRKAVEQACGVFLTAQSKTRDYKTVYHKVFANAVGYVREHSVLRTWVADGMTHARVRARVSTRKFEQDWAAIAHTVEQANNPRVIVAIVEAVRHSRAGPTYEVRQRGTFQTKVEDFFLSKGIVLMDRDTAAKVSKRDVLLAVLKDDTKAVAALGARFKADVVVTGRASAKFGRRVTVAQQAMYQHVATLNVRVVETDSARVLAVKSYGPATTLALQRGGGEDKALAKLAEQCAPKLLAEVVEAWRKRAEVSRTVQLSIAGMDYKAWKAFRAEAQKLRGVQALRLREITEATASIDVEYRYTNENLADHLTELKQTHLEVTEITANRIKLKLKPAE